MRRVAQTRFECDGDDCKNYVVMSIEHVPQGWILVTITPSHKIREMHFCSDACLLTMVDDPGGS